MKIKGVRGKKHLKVVPVDVLIVGQRIDLNINSLAKLNGAVSSKRDVVVGVQVTILGMPKL